MQEVPMQKPRALVTGAAQGIGRAAAEALLAAGHPVLATDRDANGLATLRREGLEAAVLDATDGAAIERLVADAGPIGVLVNAVGIVQAGTILTTTEAEIERGFDVNFRSVIRMIQATLPGMVGAGGGAIINIASVGSSVKAVPDRFVYSASKAAVIGLTKSVSADFAAAGICCNAVCPGPIDSPSMRDRIDGSPDPAAMRAMLHARVPAGRMGTAAEVGEMVAYLASARFVTGQVFIIDGGMSA